jgi:hypothetical protein
MAGSFDIFRKYQRQGLAALAILAMVAFFVLPPFLQMGSGRASGDPVVVSWKGGRLRRSELDYAVSMRSAVNRFLMMAESMAFNRQPTGAGVFQEDAESVVRMELLAREAAANGIVISDEAVNDFLDRYTAKRLRSEQLSEIIERLRPMGLTQQGLFATLRSGLAAQTMLSLLQSGLDGDPPGWRWDAFRRLEQSATVEALALPVADFAAEVPAPATAVLQEFFEKHKERLPDEDSPETGFREPHRVQFEYLVAKQETFEAEAAKGITDEQVAEYYEKNKTTQFRKRPAAQDAADIKPATPETKPEEGKKPDEAKNPAQEKKPDEGKKNGDAGPELPKPEAPPVPPAPPQGSRRKSGSIVLASFNRRAADGDATAAGTPAANGESAPAVPAGEKQPDTQPKPPAAEAGTPEDAAGKPDATTPSDGNAKPDAATPASEAPPVDLEPLEKVRDEIRKTLARRGADERIDAVFAAVTRDVDRYATDLALWQARRKASGAPAPSPPDIDVIAGKQGLEAGRSGLVTAREAERSGAIGTSGEMVVDPTSRFGVRRQRWLDTMFGQGGQLLRPAASRDAAGNRYISWATEDQPEYVPTFAQAREKVERRWREVEARSRARAKAEELAKQASASRQPLADVVKGAGLEPRTVGPFTWLTQGSAPFGTPPRLSEPEGIDTPGAEFMRAVFGLEPGGAAAAFNEPQTICYVLRLGALEPGADALRERFVAARKDQRRLAMVGRQQVSTEFGTWFDAFEQRQGVEWQQPRR